MAKLNLGNRKITDVLLYHKNKDVTINPTTSSQELSVPPGYTGYGTITVNPVTSSIDNNIQPGNIKKDVNILGTVGTYEVVIPTFNTKSVTYGGEYNAFDDNLTGYSSITVNVDSTMQPGYVREVGYNYNASSLLLPTSNFTFKLPSDATDVGDYALFSAFQSCTKLTLVDLSNLTTISGNSAMQVAFSSCTYLTSADLSNIEVISGSGGLGYTFAFCRNLTSVDLSNLSIVSGSSAMQYAFLNCTSLTSLSFPSLNSSSFGSYTNQFNNMLSGVTGCTVHFPSNLSSVIGSWSDVLNGFGGTNTNILYDLPATT